MRIVLGLGVAAMVLACGAVSSAQEPEIQGLTPTAVTPGATTTLRVQGERLAAPLQLWTEFPAESKYLSGDGGHAVFEVTCPAETPVGIYPVRVVNAGGVSASRLMMVDDLQAASIPDAARNRDTPFVIDRWMTVEGTVANLTYSYAQFTAEANQPVSIEVVARRLGSTLDPCLRIFSVAAGREVAFVDDSPGLQGDCRLAFVPPTSGSYLIELRDSRYQTGYFRLRIGDFPLLSNAFPIATVAGQPGPGEFSRIGVDPLDSVRFQMRDPSSIGPIWTAVSARKAGRGSSGFGLAAISTRPQIAETEPNDTPETAQRIDRTADLSGRLQTPGDRDMYMFTGKKGETLFVAATTRELGSPADVVLKLLGPDGGQLATNDDDAGSDARIAQTLPADGDYRVVVEDLVRYGGGDSSYWLQISDQKPGFRLTLANDRASVPVGGSLMLQATAVRSGYNGPIELKALDLPAGLTAAPAVIGPGRTQAALVLTATPEFAGGVVKLSRVSGTGGGQEFLADVSTSQRARWANMKFPPIAGRTVLAIAAAPVAPIQLTAEPGAVPLGKETSSALKVLVQRKDTWSEKVELAVALAAEGLPPGVTIAAKSIEKDQSSVELAISANGQIPFGEFTAVLVGTLKQHNQTIVQPTLPVRLVLGPLTRSVQVDWNGGKVKRGESLVAKVRVDRNPAYRGPLTLSFENMPSKVTANPSMLAEGQSEADVTFAAAGDAEAKTYEKLKIKVQAKSGGTSEDAASEAASLIVE